VGVGGWGGGGGVEKGWVMVFDVVTESHPSCIPPQVLTTRWVDGEKLCESKAEDVRELCNTLLNAYLVMLLETGNLHADPHPGNLLR
jgi:predicted unusual protein kinase regulating ubiquinone biosynthesis (AarF/ABC1/UbiB family)